ncbi:LemA family protein [Kerstersia similis]|uniref:LemA family protein n=1 Tax=Kerstersia similis TaxID=206505 RepID=UPI0039EE45E4
MKRIAALFSVLLSALLLSGCGYNAIQAADEKVNAAWSEVLNQYQRRADLIPNLVSTVQGYATHERQVLTEVTQARSRVGSMQITPEMLEDPEQMARFQAAQSELTSSLSRLLVVAENYPELKADAAFRDLQAQLDGTENRIAVARNRYVQAIQDYNVLVRQFPAVITAKLFGYNTKANFSVENEADISRAPTVNFGTAPATAPNPGAAQ